MKEQLESMIKTVEYFSLGKNTTICLLTLDNWYEVIWESHKLPATEFNEEVAEKVSYDDAFWKLEEVYAFTFYQNK